MNTSSFLVTGGCGFIASHLIRRLLDGGATRVVALDSLDYGRVDNLPTADPRLQVVKHRLSRESAPFLKEILSGADCVFHLAAEKHNQSIDNPQRVIDANIAGTHALLQAAVDNKVGKVVFTSSLYAYGRMQGPPYLESETPQPQTVYGISKLAGEHLCWHFNQKFGLRCMCLRYLFVYGPRQYAHMGYKSVIVKNFERLLAGEAPVVCGDGRQSLDYIYVDDAVEATLRAATHDTGFDVVNVGTGCGISVNELTTIMQRVAGTSRNPITTPADVTHGSSRVADTTKLASTLGFTAKVSIDEGLRRTFAWMKVRE